MREKAAWLAMLRLTFLCAAALTLAGCSEPAKAEWWFSCRPVDPDVGLPALDEALVRRAQPPLASALDLCRAQGEATLAGAGAARADALLGEERDFAWRDAAVHAQRLG